MFITIQKQLLLQLCEVPLHQAKITVQLVGNVTHDILLQITPCFTRNQIHLQGRGSVRAPGLQEQDTHHFVAGGHKRDTKTGLVCFVSYGTFFLFIFCVPDACSVLFPCFWLSVSVQSIAWKDSSPK